MAVDSAGCCDTLLLFRNEAVFIRCTRLRLHAVVLRPEDAVGGGCGTGGSCPPPVPGPSGPDWPPDRSDVAIRRVDVRPTAPSAYSAQARQVASLSFTHCAATSSMLWFSRSTSPPRRPSSLASMV